MHGMCFATLSGVGRPWPGPTVAAGNATHLAAGTDASANQELELAACQLHAPMPNSTAQNPDAPAANDDQTNTAQWRPPQRLAPGLPPMAPNVRPAACRYSRLASSHAQPRRFNTRISPPRRLDPADAGDQRTSQNASVITERQ